MIHAQYYDGRSTRAQPVGLNVDAGANAVRLQFAVEDSIRDEQIGWDRLPTQVGGIRRIVELEDGASLEVLDTEAFEALLDPARDNRWVGLLPRMEKSWRVAVLAVALIAVNTYLFLAIAVPILAQRAVSVIPMTVDLRIGRDTLSILDRSVLTPSQLPRERRAALQQLFKEVVADAPLVVQPSRLELRHGGRIGPNAFALPSGIMVMTDELVSESVDDDELRGVLAHETGHVVRRHAIRQLVQNSASALLLLGLLGDVNSASSLAAGVPTTLLNASYSRDLEREADAYAVLWMRLHKVPPERLGELLMRMVNKHGGEPPAWISSHPGLAERVHAAKH